VPTPYRQIIAACWAVLLVYWAWSAPGRRPIKRSESGGSILISNLVMGAGFASLALAGIRGHPLTSLALPASTVRSVAGTALVAVGVAIAIWSRGVLGANWSRVARITEGQQLVTVGPYRSVRNPIYSGFLLATCGMALTSGDVAALLGLTLVFIALWRKARAEERLLASEFGEQYAAYSRRVKRLIPFVL
jgi:protein-S-isoprenylcysteine O-methyltransferase Ste14